jgi:hypothetical protein
MRPCGRWRGSATGRFEEINIAHICLIHGFSRAMAVSDENITRCWMYPDTGSWAKPPNGIYGKFSLLTLVSERADHQTEAKQAKVGEKGGQ